MHVSFHNPFLLFWDISCGYYDPTTKQPTYTYCGIDDAKQKEEFLEYPGSVLTYEDCGNQSRSISLNFCRRVEATKKRSKLQVPRILTPHQSQLEVGGASLNKKMILQRYRHKCTAALHVLWRTQILRLFVAFQFSESDADKFFAPETWLLGKVAIIWKPLISAEGKKVRGIERGGGCHDDLLPLLCILTHRVMRA